MNKQRVRRRESLIKWTVRRLYDGSDLFVTCAEQLNDWAWNLVLATDAYAEELETVRVDNARDIEHTIGNPVFAIETNLEPLRRRIQDGRQEEALRILDSLQISVERIKEDDTDSRREEGDSCVTARREDMA